MEPNDVKFIPEEKTALNEYSNKFRARLNSLDKGVPDILYHYTSNDTFMGIVGNKEFWATNVLYMNDKLELKYAIDLMRGIAKILKQSYQVPLCDEFLKILLDDDIQLHESIDLYVVSLSEKRDFLSQWRGYGKQYRSISIGLNSRTLQLNSDDDEYLFNFLYRVIYDPKDQELIIRDYIEDYLKILSSAETKDLDSWIVDFQIRLIGLFQILVRIKHQSWNEEAEWRLVFIGDLVEGNDNGEYESGRPIFIKDKRYYRTSENSIIPYIKRNPYDKKNDGKKRIDVKEIIIPQHEFQRRNKVAIDIFMRDNGYKSQRDYEIRSSEIPIVYEIK